MSSNLNFPRGVFLAPKGRRRAQASGWDTQRHWDIDTLVSICGAREARGPVAGVGDNKCKGTRHNNTKVATSPEQDRGSRQGRSEWATSKQQSKKDLTLAFVRARQKRKMSREKTLCAIVWGGRDGDEYKKQGHFWPAKTCSEARRLFFGLRVQRRRNFIGKQERRE